MSAARKIWSTGWRIAVGALKRFVKPEHIKVFEFSPNMETAQAAAGVAHIKSLWGDE